MSDYAIKYGRELEHIMTITATKKPNHYFLRSLCGRFIRGSYGKPRNAEPISTAMQRPTRVGMTCCPRCYAKAVKLVPNV